MRNSDNPNLPPFRTGPLLGENNDFGAMPPPPPPPPPVAFAGDPGAAWTEMNDTTALALYRERERRQRTVRVLMMFLLMLLLMDEEPPHQQHGKLLRNNKNNINNSPLSASQRVVDPEVFRQRRHQDALLQNNAVNHPRYRALQERNQGVDHYGAIEQWAQQRAALEKDEFEQQPPSSITDDEEADDRSSTLTVWHYPWNATGFYRGEWTRQESGVRIPSDVGGPPVGSELTPVEELIYNPLAVPVRKDRGNNGDSRKEATTVDSVPSATDGDLSAWEPRERTVSAVDMEDYLARVVQQRYPNETAAVVLIPKPHLRLQTRNDHNLTSSRYDDMRVDSAGTVYAPPEWTASATAKDGGGDDDKASTVTLKRASGRAAFQLFSRSVPAMRQLSIVDGFVKLYDSTSPGYSTRQDVLLRVRGVLIHATGRLSLVSSNIAIGQCALVIPPDSNVPRAQQGTAEMIEFAVDNPENVSARTRRLQEVVQNSDKSANWNFVRNEALSLFGNVKSKRRLLVASDIEDESVVTQPSTEKETSASNKSNNGTEADAKAGADPIPPWSPVVVPFPFVADDKDETIRKTRTAAARIMPPREQALEANAGTCGFEINMDVSEVEWTVGAWRKLVSRRIDELKKLDPAQQPPRGSKEAEAEDSRTRRARSTSFSTTGARRQRRGKPIQDQALVVNMVGTIQSENCNFTAFLNTTALRTDWDATTSKAINYSFVMMVVCLTQILVLLRQLLHSQSQSTATRISLLCVGWQTNIDALLCLAHIYLSLAVQPLFTAFASVAFFKLLIFCVIEMKYMAIIIQARNSANGGQPTDVLRRQVAMLHLRFYLALLATFLLIFYLSDRYRMYYMLLLYSFWIPQIIMNIFTEARNPLHRHYIYGMSLTRVVSPLYVFAVPHNFLKEVYPDSPSDPWTVHAVILWVGVQTAILLAQSKYGARFMIPQRFLPPKFDYSRPIPPSMLPPGALDLPSQESIEDREIDGVGLQRKNSAEGSSSRESLSSPTTPSRHQTSETTRNRYKGSRLQHQHSSGMTVEEPVTSTNSPRAAAAPTLECSICYDAIDVRDRQKYMLAPCNHIFHRECLAQWMDVKMECPICRTELPAL